MQFLTIDKRPELQTSYAKTMWYVVFIYSDYSKYETVSTL